VLEGVGRRCRVRLGLYGAGQRRAQGEGGVKNGVDTASIGSGGVRRGDEVEGRPNRETPPISVGERKGTRRWLLLLSS